MQDNFILDLIAALKMAQSKKQVNADIKELEKVINTLRITGTFAKSDTKKNLNAYVKQLESQLNYIKLKGKIDEKALKREIDQSLNKMTYKDIDVLNVDESKVKLKVRKTFADIKTYASKNTIPVNLELKKEKLQNQLTTFLNKNSKISESSVLLKEADHVRELISAANDGSSLRDATDAFQLYKSEVSATGYATKSTTERVKDMISHITKIGSVFGVASLAVNQFRKSLTDLREIDTILTEISKTSEMTWKQISEIGDGSFKVASKYGKIASDYLIGVQEASRAGYENAKEIAELSVAAQGAGNMTADLSNSYIIATDKAYKMNGSIEAITKTLDGANNITNHNAVNMSELSSAMSVVGSQAASSQMEVNETTAAVATMIAVTQKSGSEMGNAFKGILMNLQQVTGEIEDGGDAIDEESLTKYEKACNELGVSLSTVKDGIVSLKEPMQILKELSEEYTKLDESDARRANLLSAVGGKYRANALNAILENYSLYEKMLQDYADGTGSMMEEAIKTADSWEGRLNRLQNSWDSFVNSLTNKGTIKGGISFLDNMIQGAESLVDTLGEIPIALTAINTAMVALNKDVGITQLINPETKKMDVQGNLLGLVDITAIKAQKKHMEEAQKAMDGWNNELLKGNVNINDFGEAVVQNNSQLKAYLATTSKDAPASLNGYKAYLNASGEATDALRLKAVLLNSAISFGLGIAIQLAVEGITALIRKNEKLSENVDELMSSYKTAISTANNNAQTIEGLAGRYETLSKGVNKLGENVSLTTDEYEEYNNIVNQIAEMFPDLITGYTNEGNAILSLKGNVEQLRDAYKEAQKEAYNLLLISGEDADGNDILKMWKNTQDSPFFSKMFDFGKDDSGRGISTANAIKQLEALSKMSAETYRNIEKATSAGTREQIAALSDIEKEIGYGSFISKALGIDGNVSDEDFEVARKEAKSLIQTYTAEIESALSNVQTLANAYLMTNEDYEKLDAQAKNAASILVNGIDESIANGFASKNDVGTYVLDIIDSLRDNTDFRDAIVNLLSLDYSDMPINEAKAIVDNYIDIIADELNRDPLELKVQFGFADIDSVSNNYKAILNKAAQKFSGQSFIVNGGSKLYDEEKKALEEFAKENSINTQDEIAFWNKCIEESSTREDAMQKYLASDKSPTTESKTLFANLTDSKDSIDKLTSSITSAQEAYTTLLQGNYTSSELLSSIQTITQAVGEMGGSLNWEFIEKSENSLDLLGDAIQHVSEQYANSILNGMGIDAESKFGQMLANIIQNAYESETALEAVNTQIDSMQEAYTNLTSIIESYNKTGYLTFDQLQQLLEMEPQYLACLVDENGQLALNTDAMTALANQRLKDVEAQIVQQAITELGQLALQDEKKAVEENGQAFTNAVADLAGYNAELANTIAETTVGASAIRDLNAAITGAQTQGATDDQIDTVLNNINTKMRLVQNTLSANTLGGIMGDTKKSGKEAADKYLEGFKDELEILDELKQEGKITEKQYLDQLRKLYTRYFADRKKYINEFKKYESQYLQGMRSLYQSAMSGIISMLNKQADAYSDQKDAAVEALEAEKDAAAEVYEQQIKSIEAQEKVIDKEIKSKQKVIDSIQDEIDKINELKENREKELNLQKEQYTFEKLKNQKTQKVYTEEGFVFKVDTNAISEARQAVEDAKTEIEINNKQKQINQIQREIDLLEERKDLLAEEKEAIQEMLDASNEKFDKMIEQTEKYFDSLIDGVNKYADRWQELADMEDQAKMLTELEDVLGQLGYSVEDVMNMSDEAFMTFKNSYMGIMADIYSGNNQMLDSFTELSGIDMSSLNGHLADTEEYINRLNAIDLTDMGTAIQSIGDNFGAVSDSVGNVANAISGSGGGSSSGKNDESGQASASVGDGGGSSLTSSIDTLKTKADETLGTGSSEEGKGTGIIGQFGQTEQKVADVTAAIGGESSNNQKSENESEGGTLTSSIVDLGETATETLGEPGGEGLIHKFEEFKEPIVETADHVTSISDGLAEIDGQEVECTIKVNVEQIGGVSLGSSHATGTALDDMNFSSATYTSTKNGTAHIEGTALASGNWAVQSNEKDALVGEVGYEIVVRNGRFFTVGDNGAERFSVKKGDIIFNHEQSEKLLKYGHISGRGKAYADGTVGNPFYSGKFRPVRYDDVVLERDPKSLSMFENPVPKMLGILDDYALPRNAINDALERQTNKLSQSIENAKLVQSQNNYNQPVTVHQISINCPNVTDKSGAEYIEKYLYNELGNLSLRAQQITMKH